MEKVGTEEVLTPAAVERLLTWYRAGHRDLPWRRTKDPYRIWLSEIMLQQTRVEAVKPYYAAFLEVCPTVKALAALPEERLMKLWEGLGYYSRARNLKKAAQAVSERYGGEMPRSYEELLTLPGIGSYTAGAIASIAYDVRVPAVDGNVLRVLTRLCNDPSDISLEETKKAFRAALCPVIPTSAGDFTQAMIELGAMVCVPNGAPQCDRCPLSGDCSARTAGTAELLPVRAPKKERRVEERTVLLIRDGNRTVLCRRPSRGLLAGLYELPNVSGWLSEKEVPERIRSFGFEPLQVSHLEDAKHIFTHIEWRMIAFAVRIAPDFDGVCGEPGMLLIPNDVLHAEYAIPSAFSAYTKYL